MKSLIWFREFGMSVITDDLPETTTSFRALQGGSQRWSLWGAFIVVLNKVADLFQRNAPVTRATAMVIDTKGIGIFEVH